jgi:hypothetical protein
MALPAVPNVPIVFFACFFSLQQDSVKIVFTFNNMEKESLRFRYALEKQTPRLGPGGITRGASVHEFPASTSTT